MAAAAVRAVTDLSVGSDQLDQVVKSMETGKFIMQHNLTCGQVRPGDVCLDRQMFEAPANGVSGSVSRYHVFRRHDGKGISAIFVVDHRTDDSGGQAKIVKGGVGLAYVDIELKSKRGQSLKFTVAIFGEQ